MSDTVIDQLVNYDGNNIWKDVILKLSGYNESATFAVAGGRGCGMFVASNVIYEYDTGINNHGWITRGLYDDDDLEVVDRLGQAVGQEPPGSGVEIGTDGAFPVAVAFVGTDYVMSGGAHPAFIRNGVDVFRVTVKYRSAVNGEWYDMPEVNVDAADAASYLAHMSKLVLAANGVHNGPHNELVGAGRPTTRQLEDAMQSKNRATLAARTSQI